MFAPVVIELSSYCEALSILVDTTTLSIDCAIRHTRTHSTQMMQVKCVYFFFLCRFDTFVFINNEVHSLSHLKGGGSAATNFLCKHIQHVQQTGETNVNKK